MAFGWVKWIWGYRMLRCSESDSKTVLNILLERKIFYWKLHREDNRELSFAISEKEYKKLVSILDKRGIKVYSVYGRGLPFICRAHRNRVGLLVGLGIYFALIFLSSFFVWDIKVVSNTQTPHNTIISNLNELGCYEGAFLPAIDFEDLCIDYLEEYKDFSWVSVNVRGTVAYVEIQEKKLYEDELTAPRNMVASIGGVIENCSVYEGKSMVVPGNVVKKGDLLISGIVENKEGAIRLCRAKGRIVATVDTELRVEVPYKAQRQVYTGKSYEEKKLRFFNMTFPFLGESPPDDALCTHLSESDAVVLFEKIELPLSVEKEVFREYKIEEFTYTKEEAQEAAQYLMRKRFDEELSDAELISVETTEEHTKTAYILNCKVKCRMDITTPVDIET